MNVFDGILINVSFSGTKASSGERMARDLYLKQLEAQMAIVFILLRILIARDLFPVVITRVEHR